ncbi:retinol dehydrogenase 13-like isoform X25 [Periplaneta americana]|uniref:retinol dehydrogenase 13-like isoform X25 n=1 Tax=Periplaneta americana TaxID=6978 RepID=UPI0037E84725
MLYVERENSGHLPNGEQEGDTSEIMETSIMEGEEYYNQEGGEWTQKVDTGQLCRVCANPNDYLIPIFDGEGLEHELSMKIQKHLPIKVTETDTLPQHMCYQCASTLIAWHDLVISCVEADKKLRELQMEENDDDDDKGGEMFESPSLDSEMTDDVIQPSTSETQNQNQVSKTPSSKKAAVAKEKKSKLKMILVKGPPAGTSGQKTASKTQVAKALELAKSKDGVSQDSASERDYTGGRKYEGSNRIDKKVVIITGSNTGIGKETALELAKQGAHVVMACRDAKKCEEAREDIVLRTKNRYVYCRTCDLASQKSIIQFVERFKSEHPRLDILINNAGVMRCPNSKTKEGIEMQLGVNHMGHFLLTNLLLDKLKASAPSRIINVSSVAHRKGKINKEDLNSDTCYDEAAAYNQSKLANVLFTRELAKRLQGTGVTVNAVHPGIVDTEIIRHMSFFNSTISAIFLKPFVWMFIKSPYQGARTTVYVTLEESLQNVTGKYFNNCAEEDVAPQAKDDETAEWLWAVSEKWTRLNELK